jgi:hypothetical protein
MMTTRHPDRTSAVTPPTDDTSCTVATGVNVNTMYIPLLLFILLLLVPNVFGYSTTLFAA